VAGFQFLPPVVIGALGLTGNMILPALVILFGAITFVELLE